jgi:outer membrane receptor protein involved in Fe transport
MRQRRALSFIVGIITIFLLIAKAYAGNKGILEGNVKDETTGQHLYGVNVIIQGTQLGAATNSKGFFQINNVPAGTYVVKFRMMGYREVLYENVNIRPNLRTKLRDVVMVQTAVEMEAVIVRAERPLIQKDVTGTAIKVSGERLDRLPISTIKEILTIQVGVTDEGNIRGGKSTEVLYLIDGLPVQDMISGGVGVHIPTSAVTQIEIQTGGFDSEYGNALSGVVNVITKSGTNERRFMVRGETDNFPSITQKDRALRMEGYASGPIIKDHLFYFISADGFQTDTRWWQDFINVFSSPITREYSGLGKIDAHINPKLKLSAQFLYNRRNWRDYEFSWRYNLEGLPLRDREVCWGAILWDHVLSGRTFYSVNLNYYSVHSLIGEGSKGDMELSPYEYDFYLQYIINGSRSWWADTRQGIATVQVDITSQINDYHLIKGGFQLYFYDIFGDIVKYEPQKTYYGKPILDQPLLNFSTRYQYYPWSGNVYFQDKFELPNEGGVFSVGLRYDFLDPRAQRPVVEWIPTGEDEYMGEVKEFVNASFKGILSPRIGFSAPMSDKSFFFANIGTYTQFPLFHYLYAGMDNVTLRSGMNVLKGNPDLKPETNLVWEVSIKHTIPWSGVLSVTYFSKQTKNQVDAKTFVPSNSRVAGDYGFAEYVNNDRAEARGFELNVTKEKGEWLTGNISYTYMTAEGISSTPELGIQYYQWGFPLTSNLYYLSWDQRHTFKINLNFRFPWGMEASLYYHNHTPRPFTYFPSEEGYIPDDPNIAFVPNNERMNHYYMMNVKISQLFPIGKRGLKSVTLYADSRNLLNQKNVLWIDASARVGGELGDPGAYGVGRRTLAGIQLDF